jgi:hypothetical protein
VQRFARTLQQQLGIANDHARDVIIRSKCKQLIKEISTSWGPGDKGTAFLVKTSTGYIKSSQFERAWKYHRNLWIKKVHGGKTEGVVELSQAPPSAIKQEDASRKRVSYSCLLCLL